MDEHSTTSKNASRAISAEPAREALETRCCIVGGGPAGVMLSLLLARAGVPVALPALAVFQDNTPGNNLGNLNGMRPCGVVLFEGKLEGDTLFGTDSENRSNSVQKEKALVVSTDDRRAGIARCRVR